MYGTAKAGQSKAAQQPHPQHRHQRQPQRSQHQPPRAKTQAADATATNPGNNRPSKLPHRRPRLRQRTQAAGADNGSAWKVVKSACRLFKLPRKGAAGRAAGLAKLFWSSLPEETSGKNNNLSSNKSRRLMPAVFLCLAILTCIRRWGLRRQNLPAVLPVPQSALPHIFT